MKRSAFLGLLLGCCLASGAARADDASALFQQGLALYQKGDIPAACQKFEQSYQLEAATGTLFNLASCHAKEHKYFEARLEFLKLAREMDQAGKTDKAQIARNNAGEAAQHLPKLSLQFPTPSNVERIRIDGRIVRQARWQAPIPVRAGRHTIFFGAAGMQPQRIEIRAAGDGTLVNVAVPTLSAAPTQSATPAGPAPSSEQRQSGAPAASSSAKPGQSWWTTKRTIGVIAGGAGVIAIGVGAFYGFTAISQKGDANSACGGTNGNCVTRQRATVASNDIHTADRNATYSDVGLGIGLAALAVGAYLVLTGAPPPAPADTSRLSVAPAVGPAGGEMRVSGRF